MNIKRDKKALKCITVISNCVMKIVLIVLISFPFFWMISTSLKTASEAIKFPPTIFPSEVIFDNFVYIFQNFPMSRYFFNSFFVASAVLLLQYVIIIPAAYSLARYEYRFKKLFFGVVLLGLMIPQQITFVPVYMMFGKMNLLDSYIPLILPFAANSFGIFMLRQYFMQIPKEVIEAAKLDDTSNWKIMYKIMMPMAKPALITIGLLAFISNWNSYFWPLIMARDDTWWTLPVGMATLKSQEAGQMWHYVMAGNVVLVVPILVVYIFASKKIRNSFVYSGIK